LQFTGSQRSIDMDAVAQAHREAIFTAVKSMSIGCLRRNQNWNDAGSVTTLVKVFKIQSIVQSLIYVSQVIMRGANFELNDEYDTGMNEHSISPFAHSRNTKFEKDMPGFELIQLLF
jgi:hypothetical protein